MRFLDVCCEYILARGVVSKPVARMSVWHQLGLGDCTACEVDTHDVIASCQYTLQCTTALLSGYRVIYNVCMDIQLIKNTSGSIMCIVHIQNNLFTNTELPYLFPSQ